ncbi:MAG: phosphate transport system substrate-binding protein [Haloarculaceae archaeon]|jgi:phosphate transport system substrate-binding protein
MRDQRSERQTRRDFLLGAVSIGTLALAGCTSQRAVQPNGDVARGQSGGGGSNPGGSGATPAGSGSSQSVQPLTADGSSTVYPIANDGSSLWNGNPPAEDAEYWGPSEYDIETDQNLADYFAGLYGFEATGERSSPPYLVNIALSHSGTGVKAVQEGRVDVGNSSAPVADELPDASQATLDNYVNHVVAVDGQPIVVSEQLYEAGVTGLTAEQLRNIYRKEITNWSEVGGPDKTIRAIGRAEGSGTDTAFRANLYGDAEASISPDIRKGQNQQVATLVEQSDNAIAYLALAFVNPDGPVRPISLEVDGTVYEYGKNLGAKGYPLSRDLHMYTWKDTSKKEAAFINMLLSEFGQQNCVAPNNYFKLPKDRREKQRAKLPDPV